MLSRDWGYIKTAANELIIISYRGNDTVVIVPEKIGKRKVVGILSFALSPSARRISPNRSLIRSKIEEVVVPEGIKKIHRGAFAECRELRKITLPKSLEFVGEHCFRNCVNLQEIITEKTDFKIGLETFIGCEKLKEGKYGIYN